MPKRRHTTSLGRFLIAALILRGSRVEPLTPAVPLFSCHFCVVLGGTWAFLGGVGFWASK